MQTIKQVRTLIEKYTTKGITVRLRAAGRKGIDYFNFQGVDLHDSIVGLTSAPTYDKASDFIKSAYEDFNSGVTDEVILVYNGFLNMLSQELRTSDLLPIKLNTDLAQNNSSVLDIEPDDDYVPVYETLGHHQEKPQGIKAEDGFIEYDNVIENYPTL